MAPYPAIKFNGLIPVTYLSANASWVYSGVLFSCVISVFFSVAQPSSEFLCSCLPELEPWTAFQNRGMGTLPQMRQFQKSDLVYGGSPSRRLSVPGNCGSWIIYKLLMSFALWLEKLLIGTSLKILLIYKTDKQLLLYQLPHYIVLYISILGNTLKNVPSCTETDYNWWYFYST